MTITWQRGALATVALGLVLLAGSLAGAPPARAATQTWVSGVGDDANPCSRTAPCKTFAGALGKTDAGGTITALDSGGFGAVTISKSITIDGSEVEGGILNSGVNGVIVNVAPTDRVVLRGLGIYAVYADGPAGACSPNGTTGIRVVRGGTVLIEDVRISNAKAAGILVAPTAGSPVVTVVDSVVRNGCGPAVDVAPAAGLTASVQLTNTTVSTHPVGIRAATGGSVRLTGTTVFGNAAATDTTAGGTVDASDPTNHLVANDPLVVPSISPVTVLTARTWVSGVGDDANPCSRTSPCKTLAGAYAKTSDGGHISLLDNASLGQLTISKPITIDMTGAAGRITVPAGGTGITVDAPPTTDVILRGLDIQGAWSGAADCPVSATSGIRVLRARSVHIEQTSVRNFAGTGIDVAPTSAATRVLVNGSAVSGVCGQAVRVAPAGGITAAVLLRHSGVVGNGTGVAVTTGGSVWLDGSVLSGNTAGTAVTGGSVETLSDAVAPGQPGPTPTVTVTADPTPVDAGGSTPTAAIERVAQRPVACRALPKRLRAGRTVTVLDNTCVTTAGQRVAVSATGKAGRLVRKAHGRLLVRTAATGGRLTLTMSAPGTPTHLPLTLTRTYRVR